MNKKNKYLPDHQAWQVQTSSQIINNSSAISEIEPEILQKQQIQSYLRKHFFFIFLQMFLILVETILLISIPFMRDMLQSFAYMTKTSLIIFLVLQTMGLVFRQNLQYTFINSFIYITVSLTLTNQLVFILFSNNLNFNQNFGLYYLGISFLHLNLFLYMLLTQEINIGGLSFVVVCNSLLMYQYLSIYTMFEVEVLCVFSMFMVIWGVFIVFYIIQIANQQNENKYYILDAAIIYFRLLILGGQQSLQLTQNFFILKR